MAVTSEGLLRQIASTDRRISGLRTKINNGHCPAKKILRCVNAKLRRQRMMPDGQSSDLERRVGRFYATTYTQANGPHFRRPASLI